MFGLSVLILAASLLCVQCAHTPPEHAASEFHKGKCSKYEEFIVDLAFNRTKDGTVVIIGAHNHDNDLWNHLATATTLDKVFVEPLIPSMFHEFEKDVASLTNVQVVDAAVTGTDNTSVTIYCTGAAHPKHVVFKKGQDAKHSPIAANIMQTCSLDKDRLFLIHELDIGGEISAAKKDVLKHMSTHKVTTLSLQTLISKYVKTPLRMLQIDVEGFDDQIVVNIPLEQMENKPHVIIFEHALLGKDEFHKAMGHLHDNFYITCGYHHNIFAYHVQWLQGLSNVDYSALD